MEVGIDEAGDLFIMMDDSVAFQYRLISYGPVRVVGYKAGSLAIPPHLQGLSLPHESPCQFRLRFGPGDCMEVLLESANFQDYLTTRVMRVEDLGYPDDVLEEICETY